MSDGRWDPTERPRCDFCHAWLVMAYVRKWWGRKRVAWICPRCDAWAAR